MTALLVISSATGTTTTTISASSARSRRGRRPTSTTTTSRSMSLLPLALPLLLLLLCANTRGALAESDNGDNTTDGGSDNVFNSTIDDGSTTAPPAATSPAATSATTEPPPPSGPPRDLFPASSSPFTPFIPHSQTPQFILLSFVGGITPTVIDLYNQLSSVRHSPSDCPIVATWFASIAQRDEADPHTLCNLVTGLRKGGHEMATNTYGPTPRPTKDEIMGAINWLNEECGVPLEEMRGFRTPGLGFDQTTFDNLNELGLLYDSSISDNELTYDGGRNAIWPYTMDGGIPQICRHSAGSCNATKPNDGLWEVPVYRMYDANSNLLMPVDPIVESSYDLLKRNFDLRYGEGGNRAPLAINIHASWLALGNNAEGMRQWAQETLAAHPDVHFVTYYELIEWMRNPVSSFIYSRDCTDYVTDCFPPSAIEGGCNNGYYDDELCECVCNYPFYGPKCMQVIEGWTHFPTSNPTVSPSDLPSTSPSLPPTISLRPSSEPTKGPTSVPTVTYRPTPETWPPTRSPTTSPTTSLKPTPSEEPTERPTVDLGSSSTRGGFASNRSGGAAEGRKAAAALTTAAAAVAVAMMTAASSLLW